MSAMNRRITTYRNDYNKGRYPAVPSFDGQPKFFAYPGRDNMRNNHVSRSYDQSMSRFDEREIEMRRGRNESSERLDERQDNYRDNYDNNYRDNFHDNYHDNYHDRRHDRDKGPLTDRHYDHRHERQDDYHDRRYNRDEAPYTDRGPPPRHQNYEPDRRPYDDMEMDKRMRPYNGMDMNNRMDHEDIYYDRGNLTYRREPDGYNPEPYHHMYDRDDPFRHFHMYSTTQKDYGKHETIGRIRNQPYRYRAHFDEQAKNAQSQQRVHGLTAQEQNLLDRKIHKGVYLLIRSSGVDEYKYMEHKFENNKSTVESGKGQLIGLADTDTIHLHANLNPDIHGWKIDKNGSVLALMLFEDMDDAIRWAKSDKEFKSGRSPNLAMYSFAFMRINHIPSPVIYPIYLMIEVRASFPHGTSTNDIDAFRLMITEKMEHVLNNVKNLREEDKCSSFSVNTYVDYETKLGNINAWMDRRFVFVHRFSTFYYAKEFLEHFDRSYSEQGKYSYTAVIFSLH